MYFVPEVHDVPKLVKKTPAASGTPSSARRTMGRRGSASARWRFGWEVGVSRSTYARLRTRSAAVSSCSGRATSRSNILNEAVWQSRFRSLPQSLIARPLTRLSLSSLSPLFAVVLIDGRDGTGAPRLVERLDRRSSGLRSGSMRRSISGSQILHSSRQPLTMVAGRRGEDVSSDDQSALLLLGTSPPTRSNRPSFTRCAYHPLQGGIDGILRQRRGLAGVRVRSSVETLAVRGLDPVPPPAPAARSLCPSLSTSRRSSRVARIGSRSRIRHHEQGTRSSRPSSVPPGPGRAVRSTPVRSGSSASC